MRCEVCGNDYDKTFQVIDHGGGKHVFDSLECAAHKLAPVCSHCQCRVLGHGIEQGGRTYCCEHCARQAA